MSLQFSVSKNGPPKSTSKINKRITEYNDILRWKGVEGAVRKLMKDFFVQIDRKEAHHIADTKNLHINDLFSTYNCRKCNHECDCDEP